MEKMAVSFLTRCSSVWILHRSSLHHAYVIVSPENSSITHVLILRQWISEVTETNVSGRSESESFIYPTIAKHLEGWLRLADWHRCGLCMFDSMTLTCRALGELRIPGSLNVNDVLITTCMSFIRGGSSGAFSKQSHFMWNNTEHLKGADTTK